MMNVESIYPPSVVVVVAAQSPPPQQQQQEQHSSSLSNNNSQRDSNEFNNHHDTSSSTASSRGRRNQQQQYHVLDSNNSKGRKQQEEALVASAVEFDPRISASDAVLLSPSNKGGTIAGGGGAEQATQPWIDCSPLSSEPNSPRTSSAELLMDDDYNNDGGDDGDDDEEVKDINNRNVPIHHVQGIPVAQSSAQHPTAAAGGSAASYQQQSHSYQHPLAMPNLFTDPLPPSSSLSMFQWQQQQNQNDNHYQQQQLQKQDHHHPLSRNSPPPPESPLLSSSALSSPVPPQLSSTASPDRFSTTKTTRSASDGLLSVAATQPPPQKQQQQHHRHLDFIRTALRRDAVGPQPSLNLSTTASTSNATNTTNNNNKKNSTTDHGDDKPTVGPTGSTAAANVSKANAHLWSSPTISLSSTGRNNRRSSASAIYTSPNTGNKYYRSIPDEEEEEKGGESSYGGGNNNAEDHDDDLGPIRPRRLMLLRPRHQQQQQQQQRTGEGGGGGGGSADHGSFHDNDIQIDSSFNNNNNSDHHHSSSSISSSIKSISNTPFDEKKEEDSQQLLQRRRSSTTGIVTQRSSVAANSNNVVDGNVVATASSRSRRGNSGNLSVSSSHTNNNRRPYRESSSSSTSSRLSQQKPPQPEVANLSRSNRNSISGSPRVSHHRQGGEGLAPSKPKPLLSPPTLSPTSPRWRRQQQHGLSQGGVVNNSSSRSSIKAGVGHSNTLRSPKTTKDTKTSAAMSVSAPSRASTTTTTTSTFVGDIDFETLVGCSTSPIPSSDNTTDVLRNTQQQQQQQHDDDDDDRPLPTTKTATTTGTSAASTTTTFAAAATAISSSAGSCSMMLAMPDVLLGGADSGGGGVGSGSGGQRALMGASSSQSLHMTTSAQSVSFSYRVSSSTTSSSRKTSSSSSSSSRTRSVDEDDDDDSRAIHLAAAMGTMTMTTATSGDDDNTFTQQIRQTAAEHQLLRQRSRSRRSSLEDDDDDDIVVGSTRYLPFEDEQQQEHGDGAQQEPLHRPNPNAQQQEPKDEDDDDDIVTVEEGEESVEERRAFLGGGRGKTNFIVHSADDDDRPHDERIPLMSTFRSQSSKHNERHDQGDDEDELPLLSLLRSPKHQQHEQQQLDGTRGAIEQPASRLREQLEPAGDQLHPTRLEPPGGIHHGYDRVFLGASSSGVSQNDDDVNEQMRRDDEGQKGTGSSDTDELDEIMRSRTNEGKNRGKNKTATNDLHRDPTGEQFQNRSYPSVSLSSSGHPSGLDRRHDGADQFAKSAASSSHSSSEPLGAPHNDGENGDQDVPADERLLEAASRASQSPPVGYRDDDNHVGSRDFGVRSAQPQIRPAGSVLQHDGCMGSINNDDNVPADEQLFDRATTSGSEASSSLSSKHGRTEQPRRRRPRRSGVNPESARNLNVGIRHQNKESDMNGARRDDDVPPVRIVISDSDVVGDDLYVDPDDNNFRNNHRRTEAIVYERTDGWDYQRQYNLGLQPYEIRKKIREASLGRDAKKDSASSGTNAESATTNASKEAAKHASQLGDHHVQGERSMVEEHQFMGEGAAPPKQFDMLFEPTESSFHAFVLEAASALVGGTPKPMAKNNSNNNNFFDHGESKSSADGRLSAMSEGSPSKPIDLLVSDPAMSALFKDDVRDSDSANDLYTATNERRSRPTPERHGTSTAATKQDREGSGSSKRVSEPPPLLRVHRDEEVSGHLSHPDGVDEPPSLRNHDVVGAAAPTKPNVSTSSVGSMLNGVQDATNSLKHEAHSVKGVAEEVNPAFEVDFTLLWKREEDSTHDGEQNPMKALGWPAAGDKSVDKQSRAQEQPLRGRGSDNPQDELLPETVKALNNDVGIPKGDIMISLLDENAGVTWSRRVNEAIWRGRTMRQNCDTKWLEGKLARRPQSVSKGRTPVKVDVDDVRVVGGIGTVPSTQMAAEEHLKYDDFDDALALYEDIIMCYYQFFDEARKNDDDSNNNSKIQIKINACKPCIGAALHNIGIIHLLRGEPNKASEFFERAATNRATCFGVGHAGHVVSLVRMATCQLALGRLNKATRALEEALGFSRGQTNSIADYRQSAEMLNNLGCLAYIHGDVRKANQLFLEALEAQNVASHLSMYGGSKYACHSTSLNRSVTISNIGFLKLVTRDIAGSLSTFEAALDEQQVLLRDAHVTLVSTMDHLAVANLLEGHKDKALSLLRRMLHMQIDAFGAEDHRCMVTANKVNTLQEEINTSQEQSVEHTERSVGDKKKKIASLFKRGWTPIRKKDGQAYYYSPT